MEACRDLCLTAPYRCHSFDYGDTGERVCRLSHHTSTTLTQIQVRKIRVEYASLAVAVSCSKYPLLGCRLQLPSTARMYNQPSANIFRTRRQMTAGKSSDRIWASL